ncbi:pectate lyase-like adhesive domain-containing protein [uncultured Lactobacillus sp.]|uniref:pectate lyase-like adhesive domain-containing protein n=1 Tax=uncultured Lactobacillus sp. TaxID=153152 RepID=UPI00272DC08D|nr:pectate lyase-like adhesive domain-containing protein [uncultured Lactobacillus sp.]
MKRKKFKKIKHRKEIKHYIDPNDLKEKDTKASYLKEIAGLATILGAGVTGGVMMANDRVYAAESSVDRKSEVVGSNSITGSIDEEVSNNNQKTASVTDSNSVKLSQSHSTEQSVTYSKSRSVLASMSLSTSTSFSQSASASAAVSLSESASASASASKSSSEATSKGSTEESKSQKSESKSTAENTKTNSESESILTASSVSKNDEGSGSTTNSLAASSESISTLDQRSLNITNLTVNPQSPVDLSQLFGMQLVQLNGTKTTDRVVKSDTNENRSSAENGSLTNGDRSHLLRSSFVQFAASSGTSVDVATGKEFYSALNNSNVNTINITSDFTLTNSDDINNRSITINGNNHTLYFDKNYINISNSYVTVNDATIYNGDSKGAFRIQGLTGHSELIYNNVTANGATAVWSETGTGKSNTSTFRVQGNTTINYMSRYTHTLENGTTQVVNSTPFTVNQSGTSQIYIADNLIVDDGATFTVNGTSGTSVDDHVYNNIVFKGDSYDHILQVGKNATVNIDGAIKGNVLVDQTVGSGHNNVVSIGENAHVNMTAGQFNILINNNGSKNINFGSSSKVNLSLDTSLNPYAESGSFTVIPGSGNIVTASGSSYVNLLQRNTGLSGKASSNIAIVNFEPNANVTMTAARPDKLGSKSSASNNIASYDQMTISINNPDIITLNVGNTTNGTAYAALSTNTLTVNVENTTVQVTNNGITTKSAGIKDNSNTVSGNKLTSNSMEMQNDSSEAQTEAERITNKISYPDTTQVVYNGTNTPSISASASTSLSEVKSQSEATSISTSQMISESQSNSERIHSESVSDSISASKSLSNSVSMSESLSNSVSMSESLSNSVSPMKIFAGLFIHSRT